MLLQLILQRGVTRPLKWRGALVGAGFVTVGFAAVVLHLALLPGALAGAVGRALTRFSTSFDKASGTVVPVDGFVIRQGVRLLTHFTPISVVLAALALLLAVVRTSRRRAEATNDGPPHVNAESVLLQSLLWGLPFGVGAVNLSFIHPVLLYYFTVFFALGSALGLAALQPYLVSPAARRALVFVVITAFLSLSVGRSLFAFTGGSLPTLFDKSLPPFVRAAFASP